MAKYIDLPNLKENLTNFLNYGHDNFKSSKYSLILWDHGGGPIYGYAKKTEIPSNVSELNNDKRYQTAEEVGQAVTDGVARIVAGAPEDFDTLKEMSDWISSHETSAAAMNSAISDNSVAIANHTSNSDIHVTKAEKTKWNKLDSDLKDGTIIVAEATKATQDAKGNVINETYAKKTEVPQGTAVDDALSSTSTNPVQNKVVKAEFDKLNSNLDGLEFGEVAGGKNIAHDIEYTSQTEAWKHIAIGYAKLIQDIEYTMSFTVTSNGSGKIYIPSSSGFESGNPIININSGTTRITRTAHAIGNDGITKSVFVSTYEGNSATISITDFMIEEGTTATPYEPYIPSVKMLADEVSAQNDSLSVIGKCKNLLNPYGGSTTINGITITKNKDKTYTLNGTATDVVSFEIYTLDISKNIGKTLKLVGCPRGGSHFNYLMTASDNLNVASTLDDFGNGGTKKISQWGATNWWKVYISIKKDTTVSNLVFKPMLVDAEKTPNATYDDFTPYCGDNSTLTEEVSSLKNDLSNLKDGTTPAAKAVADEDGNNIKSTYAKKTDLNTKVNIADPVFTGSFSQNRKADSTIGTNSHAEGEFPVASGNNSHAEGTGTEASGEGSHAEGAFTIASNNGSHAEGTGTEASGEGSHAEGHNAVASGESSHAEGTGTEASGEGSHAEGLITKASGNNSHAEGTGTEASNFSSHSAGKYNASMITGGAPNNTTGTAFVVGNGTSSSSRSNAFSVQYDGTVKAKSTITASTTADYAEFFEWLDENPNNEDRVGYFVTLDGNRIKIASDNDDYILGIVSGEPFVLGNGDCDTWNGMYLHDEFRRTIYEPAPKVEEVEIKEEREETYIDEETGEEKIRIVEVVVGHEFKEVEGEFDGTRPKLNPDYDNTQPYVSRFDRKEWSPVGMLGVLAVRHDGTAKVNGYVTVNKDGIATACDRNIENSYRVIKANTDSVVEVIFK